MPLSVSVVTTAVLTLLMFEAAVIAARSTIAWACAALGVDARPSSMATAASASATGALSAVMTAKFAFLSASSRPCKPADALACALQHSDTPDPDR